MIRNYTLSYILILFSFIVLFSASHILDKVWADSVVANIPVGNGPQGVAYNPNNNNMYVTNTGSNTVSVINTSNAVIANVPVGTSPQNVAYNPNNNNMYASNAVSNTVSVVNPSNTVIATIPVGTTPFGIAYNPNNNNIYVSNFGSNTVSVISPGNTVIATINVGSHPFGVEYNSNNRDVYVANNFDRTVSVIAPPPISNAGSNQIVQSFQTARLNGGASSDPSGFTPLAYQWTQTSGPTVSLFNSTSANPSFIAPLTVGNVDLNFQLVVTNSKNIQSNPSNVTITLQPPVPPIANAGSNQQIQSAQTVHLDGSASSDPSGFTPLAYQWTQTSGPAVSLSDSTSANPSFIAPNVNDDTMLTFQLVVTNSKNIQSNPSNVTVTVTPSSSPTPSSNQNGSSIPNSNINSFNNGRFLNHNNITTYDFGSHGGNSFATTGNANGGQGKLNNPSGNGGFTGSATSTAGNGGNIYGNSWHIGSDNN